MFYLPYECLVWGYSETDIGCIRNSIEQVNLEKFFCRENAHEPNSSLTKCLLYIFSNSKLNDLVSFEDRDPSCVNDSVKS